MKQETKRRQMIQNMFLYLTGKGFDLDKNNGLFITEDRFAIYITPVALQVILEINGYVFYPDNNRELYKYIIDNLETEQEEEEVETLNIMEMKVQDLFALIKLSLESFNADFLKISNHNDNSRRNQ